MQSKSSHLPIYSLHDFSSQERKSQQFQVEIFDAQRHFSVHYPHRHNFFEVLYLLRGAGFHIIDSQKYKIQPPCVFFMSPGQAHKIEFSKDIFGYIFIFTSDFYLANRSNQNSLLEFPFFYNLAQENPPLILKDKNDIYFLESLFQRSISELEQNNTNLMDLLRCLLDLILTTCTSRYSSTERLRSKGKSYLLVKRFYHLVEEQTQENLSLKNYASRLSVTPGHLTQAVKQHTGQTSSQIIRDRQIMEIKRLLVHTNLSITEIAHHLNFEDQSYFSRFFKREAGILPLQYRTKTLNHQP